MVSVLSGKVKGTSLRSAVKFHVPCPTSDKKASQVFCIIETSNPKVLLKLFQCTPRFKRFNPRGLKEIPVLKRSQNNTRTFFLCCLPKGSSNTTAVSIRVACRAAEQPGVLARGPKFVLVEAVPASAVTQNIIFVAVSFYECYKSKGYSKPDETTYICTFGMHNQNVTG